MKHGILYNTKNIVTKVAVDSSKKKRIFCLFLVKVSVQFGRFSKGLVRHFLIRELSMKEPFKLIIAVNDFEYG